MFGRGHRNQQQCPQTVTPAYYNPYPPVYAYPTAQLCPASAPQSSAPVVQPATPPTPRAPETITTPLVEVGPGITVRARPGVSNNYDIFVPIIQNPALQFDNQTNGPRGWTGGRWRSSPMDPAATGYTNSDVIVSKTDTAMVNGTLCHRYQVTYRAGCGPTGDDRRMWVVVGGREHLIDAATVQRAGATPPPVVVTPAVTPSVTPPSDLPVSPAVVPRNPAVVPANPAVPQPAAARPLPKGPNPDVPVPKDNPAVNPLPQVAPVPRLLTPTIPPVLPPVPQPPAVSPFVTRGYGADRADFPTTPAAAGLNERINKFVTDNPGKQGRYILPSDVNHPDHRQEVEFIDSNHLILVTHGRVDGVWHKEITLMSRAPGSSDWGVVRLRDSGGMISVMDAAAQTHGAAADGVTAIRFTEFLLKPTVYPFRQPGQPAAGTTLAPELSERMNRFMAENRGRTGIFVLPPDPQGSAHRIQVEFIDSDHMTMTVWNPVNGQMVREVSAFARDPGSDWKILRSTDTGTGLRPMPEGDQQNGAARDGVTVVRFDTMLLRKDLFPLYPKLPAPGIPVSAELRAEIDTFVATNRGKVGTFSTPADKQHAAHQIDVTFADPDHFQVIVNNGPNNLEIVTFSRDLDGVWKTCRTKVDNGRASEMSADEQTSGAAANGVSRIRFQNWLNKPTEYPLTAKPQP